MGIIENIPNDLIEYLKSSSNKKYETKEAGPFEFINQDDIELHLIPTDIDNSESFENDEVIYGNENDPHYKEMGCYLVKCINLVKDCEYYDPFGLLIWLPDYKCYGIWDNSHFVVYKFRNDVSWNEILNNLEKYIDSGWDYKSSLKEILIPWPICKYSKEQIYEQQKIE